MGGVRSSSELFYSLDRKVLLVGVENINKMSVSVPLKFDNVQLFSVTIDDKVWTRAKEVIHGALEYEKSTKTAHEVKRHCNHENYAHKWQLSRVFTADTPLKWPIDSQKYDLYVNEEGMYELLFKNQQLKAEEFRRYCCNEMFCTN